MRKIKTPKLKFYYSDKLLYIKLLNEKKCFVGVETIEIQA